jgi:hypothetical protein
MEALRARDLEPALAWAAENRDLLNSQVTWQILWSRKRFFSVDPEWTPVHCWNTGSHLGFLPCRHWHWLLFHLSFLAGPLVFCCWILTSDKHKKAYRYRYYFPGLTFAPTFFLLHFIYFYISGFNTFLLSVGRPAHSSTKVQLRQVVCSVRILLLIWCRYGILHEMTLDCWKIDKRVIKLQQYNPVNT